MIVTGGGSAQPKLGSNGSCYELLTRLGHRMIPIRPSLCQIETDTAPIRGLSGIRVRCGISILRHGQPVHHEEGELLFTDYGISGVCVMQCARFARPGDEAAVNLCAGLGLDRNELPEMLRQRVHAWGSQDMEKLLTGLLVPRLSLAVMKAAGILCRDRSVCSCTGSELTSLCDAMTGLRLKIRGVKGFDLAQVTAGGIDCGDF